MTAIGERALQFLFDDDLASIDPALEVLAGLEEDRQQQKLIMIPSESVPPRAVRDAMATALTSVYAEGYPAARMAGEDEDEIVNVRRQLAIYRRFADRRFYKGTEIANLVEALAQKRCARLFANERAPLEQIYVNVQALSGAAANNAVYQAICQPGDIVMGMQLAAGGHLSHGSPLNRSGKHFKIVPYGVDPKTGRLDYDEIARLAREHRPRMIIGGATSYPWDIDWLKLRTIADEVDAKLLADIAHPAGLVVAGLFPNPVGIADVTTFTTHKTMLGPRAAAIMTTDAHLAHRIDRAVFPGEQGGPHVNAIAGMAVCFLVAQTPQFHELQRRTVQNCQTLAASLAEHGLTVAYGGTNTHLLVVDLSTLKTSTGYPLKGDVAARILELVGIVCNKNTIPGDAHAGVASGIRLGTTWVSQRGLGAEEMATIARTIADVVTAIRPFRYFGPHGDIARGKLDPGQLAAARTTISSLANQAPAPQKHYRAVAPQSFDADALRDEIAHATTRPEGRAAIVLSGDRAAAMLQETTAHNLIDLHAGSAVETMFLNADGTQFSPATIIRLTADRAGDRFAVLTPASRAHSLRQWLSDLSDGYVTFDPVDVYAKVQGPVVVDLLDEGSGGSETVVRPEPNLAKPYFVGQRALLERAPASQARPRFEFAEPSSDAPLKRTTLYDEHLKLTAARNMVPFAGWSMPVWYTSISDEHQAVRTAAGLFDISHMGCIEVSGHGATRFLDLVTTNYVPMLAVGAGQYSYMLDPEAGVMDDIYIYRLEPEQYLVVVNASNEEKIKTWLRAVNERAVLIDREHAGRTVDVRPTIRDLKDPASGEDQRVDLALQGPESLRILEAVAPDQARELQSLQKNQIGRFILGGIDVLISRTGYTGEDVGFELYVHPDRAPSLWRLLLQRGAAFGLKPTGLGARDSTRTEAGFPLYGHDLAGPYAISPTGAGYGSFVKLHKPFFVGKNAFLAQEAQRTMQVIRFRIPARGVRMSRMGDPVVSPRGECIGYVTSASLVQGNQIGLAYVNRQHGEPGSRILIYTLPRSGGAPPETPVQQLEPGRRVQLPEEAIVLSRFRTHAEVVQAAMLQQSIQGA